MSDKAPEWVVPMMRAGYGARALVYLTLGGLTLAAAWTGGQTEGTQGALAQLKGAPFGTLLLWVIALGLACYGVWRWTAAWYDLERRGDDEKGLAARVALATTGTIHFALGIGVALLAMGDRSGGSNASDWTASVMQMPAGKWLVAFAALCLIGAAVHYGLKGYERKYEKYIRVTPTTQKLDPALRLGFAAYGAVLGLVGAFLLIAALRADPSEAKGIGDALAYVRQGPFGRYMLGVLGLGLIAFALENAVEAVYRIVPRVASKDTRTLRDWVEDKADAAA